MRAVHVLALAAVLTVPLAPAAADATWNVAIEDFEFNPTPLGIETGDFVIWTNHDLAFHSATCDAGSCGFDTGVLASGEDARLVIAGVGTMAYHCDVHPSMTGALHVGTRDAADPDLAIGEIAAGRPRLGAAGIGVPHPSFIDVRVTFTNAGGRDAGASTAVVALSTAASPQSVAVPGVPAGGSVTVTVQFAQPYSLATGTVTVSADVANAVVEATESDNAGSATVSLGPF